MEYTIQENRIRNKMLYHKIMTAQEASMLVKDGMAVGISGFTASGYPKSVPSALTERVRKGNEGLKISLYSGASTGPEIDEEWTEARIIQRRLPYQTANMLRNSINCGDVEYLDMHLSQCAQYVDNSMLHPLDIAIVEALAITEEGHIVPTLGIGNTPAFVRSANKVIVEVNISKPLAFEGMADIYSPGNPPDREPVPLTHPGQRIGTSHIPCGMDKIAAVVISEMQDKTREFSGTNEISRKISEHILSFLREEVKAGRLPPNLLPIQSGVGSVANAVLSGFINSEFKNLTCYTEVIQDSMLELLRSGKAIVASATAVSPSPGKLSEFEREIDFYKDKIIVRPQDISNNPEIIRRLGVISMNTALEVDIYGNVNSSHVMGSKIMNGIGGSGDFARNAFLSIFSTESIALKGAVSSIVPMVSHVDHTEHDVMVIVTEQGYADLRGLSPKERALKIINNCAHPEYRSMLMDYFVRACGQSAKHTPHILEEALSWHTRFIKTGSMR